jgi:transposase
MGNVWSAAALQAKNENDIVGLRECIRPLCERLLWALMECAAPLSYLVWQAFIAYSPLQVSRAPGSTVVPSSWFASKPGRNQIILISRRRWSVIVGIANAISKPGVFCQASIAGQSFQTSLSEAALNERRRRAVKMHLGGATIAATADQCELAERTVWAAVKSYRQGGWPAVWVRHGHRPQGSGRALSPEQEREIRRLIRDHVPDQLKMNYALWTRQAVGELIERRYGIRLAVRAVGEYLKRWGFTPQRPLKKAYEQSPAAVSKWVNEEYPKIAKRAKLEAGATKPDCVPMTFVAAAMHPRGKRRLYWPMPTAKSSA